MGAMRIAVVYNDVPEESPPDERDVLVQVEAVRSALYSLGHSTTILPCTLDLDALKRRLAAERPDAVFNLVESLDGQGRLAHLAPAVFEILGLPYTGSGATALLLTNDKILAKDRMAAAGIPTPAWIGPWPSEMAALFPVRLPDTANRAGRWIVKSVWEHASFGIDDDALITARQAEAVLAALRQRAEHMGGACFAEAFVEGREFNVALLAGTHDLQVLPPAEIIFEDYPRTKPRIVGYRAKWDADAFEYHHTPRRFDFPPQDSDLLEKLTAVARQCWKIFGLGGYARVDFRVDQTGGPMVLEVNSNPCLSPDAGFSATLAQAGISFEQAVSRILADVFKPPTCRQISSDGTG